MQSEILSPRQDLIFKRIFGDLRCVDILEDFLKSVLSIPEEEYERLELIDPFTKVENEDDKYGILDIKIHTKNKMVIDVEIQQFPIQELIEKLIFYNSKMITQQIKSGDPYRVIKNAISICITDFIYTKDNDDYHNTYWYMNPKNGSILTKKNEINLLELPKLKDESDGTNLYNWLLFLKSNTEEEFEMVTESNPKINKAYAILKELSQDEETRLQVEAREKYRRDIESSIEGARNVGKQEGIVEGELKGKQAGILEGELKGKQVGIIEGKQVGIIEGELKAKQETTINLLKAGISIEKTAEYTELSIDEVKKIKENLD